MLSAEISLWTLQYLIGCILSISIIIYMRFKIKETSLTKIFYLYGTLVAIWNFLTFFHRNVVSRDLSHLFFRFSSAIAVILIGFVVLLLAYIYKEKREYWLVLLPPILIACWGLIWTPFEIVDSRYGWTYTVSSSLEPTVVFPFIFLYLVVAVLVGLYILRKISIARERRRVKLIIIAAGVIYLGGMGVTNILLVNIQNTPPFGGILTMAEFTLIAYAISLPSIKEVTQYEDKDMEDLKSLYIDLFRNFQQTIPDERLGKAEIFLKGSLEAMGLDNVLRWDEEGSIYVDPKQLASSDIGGLVDTALKGLKLLKPNEETLRSMTDIMNHTYEEIGESDPGRADRWGEYILENHGTFLNERGMLKYIDFVENVPDMLEDIGDEKVLLEPKDKPLKAYDDLKAVRRFGYDIKCLTKYPGSRIRTRIDAGPDDILNVLGYAEEKTSTEDLIFREIHRRWDIEENTIVLIDCLDILMASLGEDRSFDLVRDVINIGEGTFVIAYNQEILKEEERSIMELKRR